MFVTRSRGHLNSRSEFKGLLEEQTADCTRPCTHKRTMSAVGITSEADPFTAYGGSADKLTRKQFAANFSIGRDAVFGRFSISRLLHPQSSLWRHRGRCSNWPGSGQSLHKPSEARERKKADTRYYV